MNRPDNLQVGDVFRVTKHAHSFREEIGELVTLQRDDGSNSPFFTRNKTGEQEVCSFNGLEPFLTPDKIPPCKMRVTEEESRKVQEACFRHGLKWAAGNTEYIWYGPHLIIEDDIISCSGNDTVYNSIELPEVTARQFIEVYGKKQEEFKVGDIVTPERWIEGKEYPYNYVHSMRKLAGKHAKIISVVGNLILLEGMDKNTTDDWNWAWSAPMLQKVDHCEPLVQETCTQSVCENPSTLTGGFAPEETLYKLTFKEAAMKALTKVSTFLEKHFDPEKKAMFQLGYIEVDCDSQELVTTDDGQRAYISYMMLREDSKQTFGQHCIAEVKRIEKENEKERKASR